MNNRNLLLVEDNRQDKRLTARALQTADVVHRVAITRDVVPWSSPSGSGSFN